MTYRVWKRDRADRHAVLPPLPPDIPSEPPDLGDSGPAGCGDGSGTSQRASCPAQLLLHDIAPQSRHDPLQRTAGSAPHSHLQNKTLTHINTQNRYKKWKVSDYSRDVCSRTYSIVSINNCEFINPFDTLSNKQSYILNLNNYCQ